MVDGGVVAPGGAASGQAGERRLALPAILIGALLLTLFGPAALRTSAALSRGTQGLQYGAVMDDSGHILFTPAVARTIAQSGAGWVHINFRLGQFPNWTDTSKFGVSALSVYDKIIANARGAGLQVLGELSNEAWQGYMAQWQEGNAENGLGNGSNAYIQGYAGAAQLLAAHFTGKVDAWEIWNEPNIPPTQIYPSNFAQLLAQSYTGIKSANRNATVVSGGIICGNDGGGAITDDSSGVNYLTATYAAGRSYAGWDTIKAQTGSYPLDALGEHVYIDLNSQVQASRVQLCLDTLHNAMVAAEGGASGKKTLVTEMGWATNAVSEQVQAANLQTAYTVMRATPYVQTAYWFFLRDEPRANLYYGLQRSSGSYKPAWKAYQQYAR